MRSQLNVNQIQGKFKPMQSHCRATAQPVHSQSTTPATEIHKAKPFDSINRQYQSPIPIAHTNRQYQLPPSIAHTNRPCKFTSQSKVNRQCRARRKPKPSNTNPNPNQSRTMPNQSQTNAKPMPRQCKSHTDPMPIQYY